MFIFLVIENALCSQKLRLQLTPKLLSRSGLVCRPLLLRLMIVGSTLRLRSFEMSNSDNDASTYASMMDMA